MCSLPTHARALRRGRSSRPVILRPVTIDLRRLDVVSDRSHTEHAASVAGAPHGGRTAIVSDAVLAETRERFPSCRCEDSGLYAGMPIGSLSNVKHCTEGMGRCSRMLNIMQRYRYWDRIPQPSGVQGELEYRPAPK